MRDSAFDPPALPPEFWARSDVRRSLERQDIGALFRLLSTHGISQTRIATATGLGQNRVSLISRDKQTVTSYALLSRIATGLGMPDHARAWLGLSPRRPAEHPARPAVLASSPGDAAELLRRISSARYIDDTVIGVLQNETDAIRLLDRRLGAPAIAAKLEAHIAHLCDSLRHSLSPQRRARLALVLADAAALAGWQAIDMGRLPAAWAHFEMATAAAREAADASLLAFAAGEQAYVLLDLGQPAQALEKVRAVRVEARTAIPRLLRGWLHAAEAEMAAASGQQVTCRSALDLAARQVTHPQADNALPYLALDATHLARWRGNCLVQFGDITTITDLTGALAAMDGSFTRAEAGLRCDLAAALHAAGERTAAHGHLSRASELAQLTGSARQRRRITELRRKIGTAA
jgi:transcriptional regulator with XRE-family HTH domain